MDRREFVALALATAACGTVEQPVGPEVAAGGEEGGAVSASVPKKATPGCVKRMLRELEG